MLITITTSGGLLGTGLPGKSTVIDTQGISGAQKDEACRQFDPQTLAKLVRTAHERASGADRVVYHVTVRDAAGKTHAFDLPEAAMPAQMLDLIDEF